MKFVAVLSLALLGSCTSLSSSQSAPGGSAPPGAPEKLLTLYAGGRSLSNDWTPVEDQATFQVEYSNEDPAALVGWEVGLAGSSDTATADLGLGSVDVTGTTFEFYGGVRKTFGNGNLRPYIGGGLSVINAQMEVDSASEDDTSPAGYVHGGVQFLASPSFSIGLDLRALFGSDMTVAGFGTDADYTQAALTFGWRF